MKTAISSIKEMDSFASSLVETNLKENKGEKALVVGLKGDLGAGKTTFTKSVAKTLGVEGAVTSPTFVIEKIYKLPELGVFSRLIHIDAYRLDDTRELSNIGWEELVNDPENLILLEWPEKVEELLPKNMITINFKFIDEDTREIEY